MKQLDSSVKRNTALVKKLRQLTEESMSSIMDDIGKVNQNKYVSEVVTSIAEAPLNVKDLPAALSVCSLLHRRYAEFGEQVWSISNQLPPMLYPQLCHVRLQAYACALSRLIIVSALTQISSALARVFSTKPASPDEERLLLKRKRTSLRLLSDLVAAGICTSGPQPMQGIITDLAATSLKKDRENAQNALALLSHFAKGAREHLLGLPPIMPAMQLPSDLLKDSSGSDAEAGLSAEVREALATLRREQAALDVELSERFLAPAEERAMLNKASGVGGLWRGRSLT